MSDSIKSDNILSQSICNDCAFHVKAQIGSICIHPDESDVNCGSVLFCSSFQPAVEIDSPCVTFGEDEPD